MIHYQCSHRPHVNKVKSVKSHYIFCQCCSYIEPCKKKRRISVSSEFTNEKQSQTDYKNETKHSPLKCRKQETKQIKTLRITQTIFNKDSKGKRKRTFVAQPRTRQLLLQDSPLYLSTTSTLLVRIWASKQIQPLSLCSKDQLADLLVAVSIWCEQSIELAYLLIKAGRLLCHQSSVNATQRKHVQIALY